MMEKMFLFLFLALLGGTESYWGNKYCSHGRDAFVHLFEWKWVDIERECSWLANAGYCAIQVSPPTEHVVIHGRYPWYQRYQPVSYRMGSRSGTEAEFRSMVSTCNDLGVYIYVDAVINHMSGGGSGTGSDGSNWNAGNGPNYSDMSYPGVPYGPNDFNGRDVCHTWNLEIHDYNNAYEVRYCRLLGLRDLRGGSDYVRQQISDWMNRIIGWGVAGFRIDASKHMWPGDIEGTLQRVNNLNTRWFPRNTRPYVYMEVIWLGGEPITPFDYTHIGRVTEFRFGRDLGECVRKVYGQRISFLRNFGPEWGYIPGLSSVSFTDNHDNQRGHGAGGFNSLVTFFEARQYKIANAFQLAWNYGHTRIMSSYNWPRNIVGGIDTNDWVGPPSDGNGNTNTANCASSDWICEHRWRQIANMVRFHNAVLGQPIRNWWDNGYHAIAFSRGNRGFLAINNENYRVEANFQTGLPAGQYCNVILCNEVRPPCTGGLEGGCDRDGITVNSSGWAWLSIPNSEDPMVALHV